MMQNNVANLQRTYQVPFKFSGISDVHIAVLGQLKSDGNFEFTKFNTALNIHFVYSGKGRLVIDGRSFDIVTNDVFILYPQHHVHYYDYYDTPWSYDWFTLSIPAENRVLESLRVSQEHPVKKFDDTDPIWDKAKKIATTLKKGRYSALYPVVAGWELLNLLHEKSPETTMDQADKLKGFIDTAERPVTVNELADHFSIDRSTVYRLFKGKFKISVKDYIENQKYQNVCDLLRFSNYTVSAIAAYCGFDSPHYFSRVFRKRFGMSPSQWRDANKSF